MQSNGNDLFPLANLRSRQGRLFDALNTNDTEEEEIQTSGERVCVYHYVSVFCNKSGGVVFYLTDCLGDIKLRDSHLPHHLVPLHLVPPHQDLLGRVTNRSQT